VPIAGEPQDRQRRQHRRHEDNSERVSRMLPSGRYLLGELIKLPLDGFEFIGDRVEFTAEVSDFVQRVRVDLTFHTVWQKSVVGS
jgi:hypothetical protein